jgi:hypothetical protein
MEISAILDIGGQDGDTVVFPGDPNYELALQEAQDYHKREGNLSEATLTMKENEDGTLTLVHDELLQDTNPTGEATTVIEGTVLLSEHQQDGRDGPGVEIEPTSGIDEIMVGHTNILSPPQRVGAQFDTQVQGVQANQGTDQTTVQLPTQHQPTLSVPEQQVTHPAPQQVNPTASNTIHTVVFNTSATRISPITMVTTPHWSQVPGVASGTVTRGRQVAGQGTNPSGSSTPSNPS